MLSRVLYPAVLAFAVFGTGPTGSAHATPLDAETCKAWQVSEQEFEKAGVRQMMAMGPQWAKANLPADKLALVAKLIEIDETLQFRCHILKPLPAEAVKAQPARAEIDPDAPVPPRKPRVKPKPAATTAAAPAAAETGAAAGQSAPAPAVKPRPKPRPAAKSTDAYTPAAKAAE